MVYAETVDFGPYVGVLQAFGPPEVVALEDFAGNGSAVEEASGFWEVVSAVSFQLATDNTAVARIGRVRLFAGEATPFATVLSPYGVEASHTSVLSFGDGSAQAGFTNAPAIVAPLLSALILPKWSVVADVVGGVAGDAVTGVRVYRQRYRLLDVAKTG